MDTSHFLKRAKTSTHLAVKYRVTNDYITQLCRKKRLIARFIGRAWFIDEESLVTHLENAREKREVQRKALSKLFSINHRPRLTAGMIDIGALIAGALMSMTIFAGQYVDDVSAQVAQMHAPELVATVEVAQPQEKEGSELLFDIGQGLLALKETYSSPAELVAQVQQSVSIDIPVVHNLALFSRDVARDFAIMKDDAQMTYHELSLPHPTVAENMVNGINTLADSAAQMYDDVAYAMQVRGEAQLQTASLADAIGSFFSSLFSPAVPNFTEGSPSSTSPLPGLNTTPTQVQPTQVAQRVVERQVVAGGVTPQQVALQIANLRQELLDRISFKSVDTHRRSTPEVEGVQNLIIKDLDCTSFGNGGKLTTDADGNVVCADDGGSGGGGGTSAFGQTWELFGSASYLAPTTTTGVIVSASSTIGNGNQNGGLTINGGATTTGNLRVQGTFLTALSDGCAQIASGALTSTGSNCGSGSFSYLFPGNATTTLLALNGGLTTTNATTSNFAITNLGAGSLLKVGSVGNIIAAVAGTDYQIFGYPFSFVTSFGTTTAATTTSIWTRGGIFASTTSVIGSTTFAANGNVGIGTSTPTSLFSINPTNGQTGMVFSIGSSTGSLFTVDTAGTTTINTLRFGDTGGNGFFWKMRENASNNLVIEYPGAVRHILLNPGDGSTDGNVGIGTTSPWAQLSVNPNGISGPSFAVGSSTKTQFVITSNGNIGIGTSSPYARLSISANNGEVMNTLFAISSSTSATTTSLLTVSSSGLFSVGADGSNLFTVDAITGSTTIANLSIGNLNFDTNAGLVSLANLPVDSNAAVGTPQSMSMQIDDNAILTVYAESNGIGSIRNATVGIGTTSPRALLNVVASGLASSTTNVIFSVGSSTALGVNSTFFSINNIGSTTMGNFGTCSGGNALTTDSNGVITCGAITGGAGVFPFTGTTNFGAVANSTSTAIWFQAGLQASSTSYIASTTFLGTGFVGVASSTPFGLFSINPSGLIGAAPAFVIGSSTATTFIVTGSGSVGVGTTSPAALFSVHGSAFFGTSTFSTITFNAGIVNYALAATNTIQNTLSAYSISTTTVAGQHPIFNISGNGATSTLGFFVSTSTGLTAGVGVGLPNALRNMVILGNGFVQAGMAIVNGGLCVDSDGWCTASTTGRISATSVVTSGADLAEMYLSHDALEPGDIVSSVSGEEVERADKDSKERVIGIVSTKPGFILGLDSDSKESSKYAIALAGRVPLKVSIAQGVIKVGDALMLSSTTPGVAVKATTAGVIVAKALQDYSAPSTGLVMAFVENTFYTPPPVADAPEVPSFLANLVAPLVNWFAQATNGITDMFASVFHASEKICVDDQCLNKDDVRALLLLVHKNDPAPAPAPEPESQGTSTPPAPEPEPQASSTPEVVTPEPTPEPEPAPASPAEASGEGAEPTPEPAPAVEPTPAPEPAPETPAEEPVATN